MFGFIGDLFGGGESEAEKAARESRKREEERQRRIKKGTKRVNNIFGQFDDDFYDDRHQSYLDFARPQVDREFGDASEQLTYALARNGTMNSSVAGDERSDLQTQYDINLQDITDKAREFETNARNSVEQARSGLITTLNATGDATGAANSALNRAESLSQTPAYSPIGQLFTDFSSGLSQQAALERAEAASGRDYARYNTRLFGAPAGAVENR